MKNLLFAALFFLLFPCSKKESAGFAAEQDENPL
jgi:hypothetical protein